MPPELQPIILGVGVPLALAAMIVFPMYANWRKDELGQKSALICGFAFALAYMGGHLALRGMPDFPATEAAQWLVFFVPGFFLWSVIEKRTLGIFWFHVLGRFLLIVALTYLLLQTLLWVHWPLPVGATWLLGTVALGLAYSLVTAYQASISNSIFACFSLMAVASLSAIAIALTGSLFYAQLLGVMAAGIAPILAVAWLKKGDLLCSTVGWLFSVLHFALLLCGFFYSELPLLSMILLFCPIFFDFFIYRYVGERLPPKWSYSIRTVVLLVPALIAVGIAFLHSGILDTASQAY